MLEAVEVLNAGRTETRRAVHVECEIISDRWEEAVPHLATDLSLRGMWVETTFPLPVGEQILVSFTPPRWRHDRQILALARVRRVHHPSVGTRIDAPGMALEFLDLAPAALEELRATLRGLPPRIRESNGRTSGTELVWVDTLLTFEDPMAPIDVSAAMADLGEDELSFFALSAILPDRAA
jgi:hypothetical protein